jgi:SPP1 family predicted phage head-tail adaptor
MSISKGLFNNTLTLQTLAETADGQGGTTSVWTDAGSFRARISSLSAQERLIQNKTTAVSTHKIFCDSMTVTTADRIKWGDVYFQITGITNPSEAYHHLELLVTEIL